MSPTTLISDAYRSRVAGGFITTDSSQLAACRQLDVLAHRLIVPRRGLRALWGRFFQEEKPGRGVYLYGGVGRGKSYVMDLFFATLPLERKFRVHYHQFMKDTERAISRMTGQANSLDVYAGRLAQEYDVLCLDELHISDIVEASFLARILESLSKTSLRLVVTSNFEPESLYKGGINRTTLLPAIDLLRTNLTVLQVDSGIDYRQSTVDGGGYYLLTGEAETPERLQILFQRLNGTDEHLGDWVLEGRSIPVRRRGGAAIWFDFHQLCGGMRSKQDYLAVSRHYPAVILENVPLLDEFDSDAARRFTWLVDILYDNRNILVVSAAAAPALLYREGQKADEFVRTASRLLEMQTPAYVAAQQARASRSRKTA